MSSDMILKGLKLSSNGKINSSTIAQKLNLEMEEAQNIYHVIEEADTLVLEAIEFLNENKGAGPDLLKTELKIGGNRATRIIDFIQNYSLLSSENNSSSEKSSVEALERAERWARVKMHQEKQNKDKF